MTKRVTLSVPDDLAEKIEHWKEDFNLSKVFQDAIAKAIQEKEDFQRRLNEEQSMEEVLARLRKEQRAHASTYREVGFADGVKFAKAAPYAQLIELGKEEDMEEFYSQLSQLEEYEIDWHEFCEYIFKLDEKIEGHLEKAMQGDPFMWGPVDYTSYPSEDYTLNWIEGWFEGFSRTWNEIKNELLLK